MSAQTRIIPQEQSDNGFAQLMDIIDIIKNPKQAEEAHRLERERIALTDQEKKKAEEARAFISKYEELYSAFQKQKSDLDSEKKKYALDVSEFDEKVRGVSSSLDEKSNELKVMAEEQAAVDVRQAEERKKINEEREALQKIHDDAMREVRNQQAVNEQVKSNLETKAQEIARLNKEVETRLAKVKLREQAADL